MALASKFTLDSLLCLLKCMKLDTFYDRYFVDTNVFMRDCVLYQKEVIKLFIFDVCGREFKSSPQISFLEILKELLLTIGIKLYYVYDDMHNFLRRALNKFPA